MASINPNTINPLDTSLLSYSGAQDFFGLTPSNSAGDLTFSYYLQTVIDRLSQAQTDAITSVNSYNNTGSTNLDQVLSGLNEVNSSLKDVLAMRVKMMQAYQSINFLGI